MEKGKAVLSLYRQSAEELACDEPGVSPVNTTQPRDQEGRLAGPHVLGDREVGHRPLCGLGKYFLADDF